MTKQFRFSCALASFVCMLACASQAAPQRGSGGSPDDLAGVRKVLSGIIAADNAGDLDAVITHYADDAILLPPNDSLVVGKLAIRGRYEESFRHFRFDITLDADETQVFGDWAFVRGAINGRTLPKGNDAPRKLREKYIMVLRRQKDGWRIARLIWNASEPLPPAAK